MTTDFQKRYWITEKLAKDLTALSSAMYAEKHPELELNNPRPLFEALGIRKPKSMRERLERLFEGPNGLIAQMYEQGEETPEEMMDFDGMDVEEDEPLSPYEVVDMVEEQPATYTTDPKPDPVEPTTEPLKPIDPDPENDPE